MNKQVTIFLLSLLICNTLTIWEVGATTPLVIESVVITSESGLFVSDIAKFRVTVKNPNTEVRTDTIVVTLNPQVATFTPIPVTLDGGASRQLDLQFLSQTTGNINITAMVQDGGATMTNNEIYYYNYGAKMNIMDESYYPVGSNNIIKTVATVSNNGASTVEFQVLLKLTDSGGSMGHQLVPKTIVMSQGTPPSPIPTNSQFNLTIPAGAQATITSEYQLTTADPTGPWTAELEAKPTLKPSLIRRGTDQTNVRSPEVSMVIEAEPFYIIGKSMRFYINIQNGSGVKAYIEQLEIKMFDSSQIDKLKGNVVVRMDSQLGTNMYGVEVGTAETKPIAVEIALDKGMVDEFTQSTYWTPNQPYKLQAEAYVRGDSSPTTASKDITLQPFNPPVEVSVKTPATFKKNEVNTITIVLTNTTEKPIANMKIRFGVTGPQKEKIVPDPSELIGINLESSLWGGSTLGNIKEIQAKIVPRNEGLHTLEYAFNDETEFNPTGVQFYVSAIPANHNIQIEPVSLPTNQYVIGAPVTFPVTIANKGTYSEYYNAYVEVRSRDGSVYEGRYDVGNGNLEPGEATTKTVSIITTEPNGIGLGEKSAKVYVEYHTTPTITEVPFSVISPVGTTFTAISTDISTVTVGEQKVLKVTVTNNHNDRRHYTVTVVPDPNLGFTRSEWDWDLAPNETRDAEFLFQPRSESVGAQVVQIFVNSRQQTNAQFLVISKVEAEKQKTEGQIFNLTTNTILILVVFGALCVVGYMFIRGRKKVPQGPRASQQIESRRGRMG